MTTIRKLAPLASVTTIAPATAGGEYWLRYSQTLHRDIQGLRDELADMERALTSVTLERDFLLAEKRLNEG